MNGKFYGVSVGPGDPELITVKAVNTIKKCSIIIVPQTKNENMLALSIAQKSVDMTDKLIVPIKFLMSHDLRKHRRIIKDPLRQSWSICVRDMMWQC